MMAACSRKLCFCLAACAALSGCVSQADKIGWGLAGPAFLAGEADAPMVYTKKEASHCVGLWVLHAQAVDDGGTFPAEAHGAFPEELRLKYAMGAAEFFRLDPINEPAYRQGANDANVHLRGVLAGDREAFQRYFEALGRCSTKPEPVSNAPADGEEGPAGE